MHCTVLGKGIIICGSRKMSVCECGHLAGKLCDAKIAEGKTCDKPVCHHCSVHREPDLDFCREHEHLAPAEQLSLLPVKVDP
jgi:hypothetical protein